MKTALRLVIVGLVALAGYVGTSAQAQTPDSTRQRPVIRPGRGTAAATDTLPPAETAADEMEELVDSLTPAVDTVNVSAAAEAQIHKIVPRIAAIRSAVLPGWGQVYNRQYWKVPLVVAGFGTFGYFITTLNRQYQYFRGNYQTAYNIAISDALTPNVVTEAEGREVVIANAAGREVTLNQWRSGTEFYRRWRDYNFIFTALFWGLNIVDANVSAHLKTFDISDSLTLKYTPTVMPSTVGFVPGLKLTMSFRK